jgi:hypothetical protein
MIQMLGARGTQNMKVRLLANETRMWLVIGTWLSVAIAAFAACIQAGAPLSAGMAVSVGCLAPGGVAFIIGMSVPSSPMGTWLHGPNRE